MKNQEKRTELKSELLWLIKDMEGYINDLQWEDDLPLIKEGILSVINDFTKNVKDI